MTREEQKRFAALKKELQAESAKRKAEDLAHLRKPYYYKGRFESLTNQQKREKIRLYYQNEKETIAQELKELYNMEEWRNFSALVEWSRSRVWGMNPHAKIIVNNKYVGFGSASGCGYDKLSAAVCYGCNDEEITAQSKKIILGAVVRAYCRSGRAFPYGIYKTYKLYLHFDGCGISTLRSIAEYCGLTNWTHYETKQSDYISIC